MGTTKRLKETLEKFAPADTVAGLTEQFGEIAQVVFNGHFVVNGTYGIYPVDIEFYFHSEDGGPIVEPQMYHKGNVPYFPVGSICPNRSGVDMTFEREGKYRASFLIRGYTYRSFSGEEEEYTNSDGRIPGSYRPQYLWEDLLGNAPLLGEGLSIMWIDDDEFKEVQMKSLPRVNIHKIEGENEHRMWRFTKL